MGRLDKLAYDTAMHLVAMHGRFDALGWTEPALGAEHYSQHFSPDGGKIPPKGVWTHQFDDLSYDPEDVEQVLEEAEHPHPALMPPDFARNSSARVLAMHLVDLHRNEAALGNDAATNIDLHHWEHHGPGGLRNHRYTDLSYGRDRAAGTREG
jgi:hypothetical protein